MDTFLPATSCDCIGLWTLFLPVTPRDVLGAANGLTSTETTFGLLGRGKEGGGEEGGGRVPMNSSS